MAKKNKFIALFQRYPIAVGILALIILIAGIKLLGGSNQQFYVKEGVISNTDSIQPVKEAKKTEKMIDNNQSGIVSFEMYIPDKNIVPKVVLSREEKIEQIANNVSSISDELKAKNTIIKEVSALQYKINASELLTILRVSNISDPFYYATTVKRIAPILDYPISKQHIKEIIMPVSDIYYRHKLEDELIKEQRRNR